MKRAIFPGTFDPFTIGHYNLVMRGLNIFDEIVIGIGVNLSKKTLFDAAKRINIIEQAFSDEPRVRVMTYDSLTVDFATSVEAEYILRGLRTVSDFEYEMQLSQTNSAFLRCLPLAETTFNVVNCFDLSARLFCFELQRLSFTFQSTSLICFYLPNFSA